MTSSPTMPNPAWARAVEAGAQAAYERYLATVVGEHYTWKGLPEHAKAYWRGIAQDTLRAALPHLLRAVVEGIPDSTIGSELTPIVRIDRDPDWWFNDTAAFRAALLAALTASAERFNRRRREDLTC